MKKFKKIFKLIFVVLLIVCTIVAATAISQYRDGKAETKRKEHIQALIDAELNKDNTSGSDDNPSSGGNSLQDIISGSINDSKVETVFSDIIMINSSTFTATLNGETKTYRLIGVDSNGNSAAVKAMLESLTKITITHDTMIHKKNDTVELIYLWNQDDQNINNMVNLQIIRQGHCDTTYLGTGYAEHPNIKYSTYFVQAAKDSKK